MIEEYESDEEGVEYYAVRPNKTQIKKDIAALFILGEEMSTLSTAQVNTLELPDKIHKAVIEVSGMPHKGARKRLLKFIAAQLHKIDVEPIQEKFARIKNKSVHSVREHHIIEQWRDRLIADGTEAVHDLLAEQPQADRQQLRQLLRNVKKETEANKPPKSSRLLYRFLKELFKLENELELDFDDDENDELETEVL
jgi:ribosome-associated protein